MEIGSTPYPWHALQKVPRSALRAIGDATELLQHTATLSASAAAAASLLSEPSLRVVCRRVRMVSPERPVFSNGVLCLIANQDRSLYALVEVEPELAHRIASTLLSRPPLWVDRAQPTPPSMHAAFGGFLIAVARNAYPEQGLNLVAVGPSARQGFVIHSANPSATADLSVVLQDATFNASVVWHTSTCPTSGVPSFGAEALRCLGSTPLQLNVVAAASISTRGQLASLETGDAWMPAEGWSVELSTNNALNGEVSLMTPLSDQGLPAHLHSDGKIVLGKGMTQSEQPQESTDADASDDVAQALADAPVVVRVEVGAVTLRAREWANARPGDVLTTGQRIAERVSLRVSGIEVARGELVDVEGQVGVRIHEILAAKDGEK